MATFFTKEEARAAARSKTAFRSSQQILREAVVASSRTASFDVFLSHSYLDADLVLGVKVLLEQQGLTVYVDWIADPQLDRTKVTKDTAAALRDRMGQCKSLMFIASENSSSSKWMPWELGYFDGLRQGSVAILPLTDRASDSFSGQEYLGLYPVVRKHAWEIGNRDIRVEEPGRRWLALARFAGGSKAWSQYAY